MMNRRNVYWARRYSVLITLALVSVIAAQACNDETATTTSSQPAGPGPGGSGGDGSGGLAIASATSGVLQGGAAPTCGCSADLKEVVCNGQVMTVCTGDQACLNGMCTNDPCGAAEASKSSYGCDYWALRPDVINVVEGACFAAFVANTWSIPVHIDVTYQGNTLPSSAIQVPQGQGQTLTYAPYDPVNGLPADQVAIVFLAENTVSTGIPCPVPAAIDGDIGVDGTGFAEAFNIVTDRPVQAYSMLPYGGGSAQATSATLLLPTSAWDSNYLAINAYPKSQTFAPGQPSLNILARVDATVVTLTPVVPVVGGGGVASTPAAQPVIYNLDAGDYLQISQNAELTGSPINANNPVGVWGSATCLTVPVNVAFCDSAHQQIAPVRAMGTEYAGVRHRNRFSAGATEEAPPWRLVGFVDGTTLTWTPMAPPGAPTTLQLGEVAEFSAAGPFVVSAQKDDITTPMVDESHPFYLGQYMTGSDTWGTHEGDPEWVNVIPTDQYLDYYVFFTDPTYSETNLVVTRKRSIQPAPNNTFRDVTLDCAAGPLTGWTPLNADLEYTRVDLVTGNFMNVGGCSNGRRKMESEANFTVTVWGWGLLGLVPSTNDVSYAYPAGAGVSVINQILIPPVPE